MTADPNEILLWFRATEDSRYALTNTFVVGKYRYATNGFICARMRCDESDTEGNCPPVAALKWSGFEYSNVPISLPAIETIPTDPSPTICTHCHGTGKWKTEDHDGSPLEMDCGWCENGMVHPHMPAMLVAGLEIALDCVRLLSTHSAILFAPLHNSRHVAYFKIGVQIEGLVAVRNPGDSIIVEPITPNITGEI